MLRGIVLLIRNPRLLRLVPRLMFDRRAPLGVKLLLVGAVAYLLSPVDLLPDFLPIKGVLDDILFLLLSLALLLGTAPRETLSGFGEKKRGPKSGPVIEGDYRVKRQGEREAESRE